MTKTHPSWQKGKLNGIGGRIEAGESSDECMVRETQEEIGLTTNAPDWRCFATIEGEDWSVDFYALRYGGQGAAPQAMTDEPIGWYTTAALPQHCLPNIYWLVPMALDALRDENFKSATITYTT